MEETQVNALEKTMDHALMIIHQDHAHLVDRAQIAEADLGPGVQETDLAEILLAEVRHDVISHRSHVDSSSKGSATKDLIADSTIQKAMLLLPKEMANHQRETTRRVTLAPKTINKIKVRAKVFGRVGS